jgi:hypothetical protein
MPESRKESVVSLGSVSLGNIQVSNTPPTSGTAKTRSYKGIGTATIPAGADKVEIVCVDYTDNAAITINGVSHVFNQNYADASRLDPVNNVQNYVGAISVVSNGFEYYLFVSFPSNHAVNLATIIS